MKWSREPGERKDRYVSKETRLERETEWAVSITTAQREDVLNIWQLTKDLLALLDPWVPLPLDKKFMC